MPQSLGGAVSQRGCCRQGSPSTPRPSQVCSVAMDLSPWKQHLLGLGPPGGSWTPAASTSHHLFLIGLSSTGWLCLQEGPEQQQVLSSLQPLATGDNAKSLQLHSTGPSHRENKHGWMNSQSSIHTVFIGCFHSPTTFDLTGVGKGGIKAGPGW